MTVLAELSVPNDAFTLGQVLETPGAQIEVLQCVAGGQASVMHVQVTGEYDAPAFERRVRDDDRVDSLTPVQRTFQTSLYRLDWSDGVNGMFSTIHDHGLIIEQAIGTANHWTLRLRAPDQAAIETIRRECHTEDIPITALNIMHRTDGLNGTPYNLTSKQREAVRLAFERGHFQVPREVSLTELAEELNISRQAFTRRLHRGLHGILTALLDQNDHED
jgi:predicted DNA binding protein